MSIQAQFFGPGNDLQLDEVPRSLLLEIEPWIARFESGRGPAFLPRRVDDCLFWYGLAGNARARRELLELLDAWIGPGASDLSVKRGLLAADDPFDAWLTGHFGDRLLRFEVWPSTSGATRNESREWVRDSLRRLVHLLELRPATRLSAVRSTAHVLEDLTIAANAGDRALVDRLTHELATDTSLDEANLLFQRVRVAMLLTDWADVLRPGITEALVNLRRPPGVSRAIPEAVFRVHLADVFEARDGAKLMRRAEHLEEPVKRLVRGAPDARTIGALAAAYFVALTDQDELAAERQLRLADELQSGLAAELRHLGIVGPEAEHLVPRDPFGAAQDRYWQGDFQGALDGAVALPPSSPTVSLALMAAASVGTPAAAAEARGHYDAAVDDMRIELHLTGPLAAAYDQVVALSAEGLPTTWNAWLGAIETVGDATELIAHARQEGADWPALSPTDLIERLERLDLSALAAVGSCGGAMLAAHAALLPSVDRMSLNSLLLQALAMADRITDAIRAQAYAVVEDAVEANAPGAHLAELIDFVEEMRQHDEGPAATTWLVDLLQLLTYEQVPEAAREAVTSFAVSVLETLTRYRNHLSRTSLTAVREACAPLGLTFPGILAYRLADAADDDYQCLAERRVVIYSLMETAAKRAAAVLREVVPTVDVETTADHVESDRLAALAANADVFVIVVAAAKHAATSAIETHRGERTLLRVHSKGSSAILRELAAHCA